MKKFFTALLLIFTLASESYAESNSDVYVRQDVFDSKMEALFSRLDGKIDALANQINGKIDALANQINGRIDALAARMDGFERRLDSMDKRIDFMSNFLYYILVLLAALIILPPVSRWFEAQKEAKNFTLDDVRKLIAEEISKKEKIYAPA